MADEFPITKLADAIEVLSASGDKVETAQIMLEQVDQFLTRLMADYAEIGIRDDAVTLMTVRLAQYKVELSRRAFEETMTIMYEAMSHLNDL